MFSWKRDSADISQDEPIFRARYVGCTETLVATGNGCTAVPMRRLWASRDRESLRKVTVQISTRGVFMYDVDKSFSKSWTRSDANQRMAKAEAAIRSPRYFCMEDISYCAADTSVDDRMFCWICRNLDTDQMELHAVLCSGKDKAQTMAAVLSRAFQHAYRFWKSGRAKGSRREIEVGQSNPCVGLAFYNTGGNPLSKVKLEKGSQRVSSKSTTSV